MTGRYLAYGQILVVRVNAHEPTAPDRVYPLRTSSLSAAPRPSRVLHGLPPRVSRKTRAGLARVHPLPRGRE